MSRSWRLLAALSYAVLVIALPARAQTTSTEPVLSSSKGSGQAYPTKAVRIIAPFPAGGGTDIIARTVAQKLSAGWGQQAIVDNRSGAGGMIGSELVAKAPADGYTLLITSSSTHAINPHLAVNRSYDPLRDFTPVAMIASGPNVLVVHPSVPVHTVSELAALARSKAGQLNYASTGIGTLSHLTAVLFGLKTGARLVHVPYKGGPPALTDIIAGQVSLMFIAVPTAAAHMRAGRLRGLAVTGKTRLPTLKNIPTVAETIPGFESVQWWGLYGPAGMASDIVAKLNADTNVVLRDPDVRARFEPEGVDPGSGAAASFDAFARADYEKWGKVIQQAGLRPE